MGAQERYRPSRGWGAAPFAGAAVLPSQLSYGAGIAICSAALSIRYLTASSTLLRLRGQTVDKNAN